MTTGSDPRAAEKQQLLQRYEDQINWYWTNSGRQKKRYIYTRFTILVLGALVTLIASLSAATFIEGRDFWDTTFKIATPVLAALLAVITGLTQTFQWGAAWREMNLAAMTLEKERDRIKLTPPYRVDAVAEIEKFNDVVIDETRRYFERVTGATRSAELERQVTAAAEAAVAAVAAARPRDVDLTPVAASTTVTHTEEYVAPEATDSYATESYDTAATEETYDAAATEETYDGGGEGGSPFAAEGDAESYEEGGEGGSPFAAEGDTAMEEGEGEGGAPFATEGDGEDDPP